MSITFPLIIFINNQIHIQKHTQTNSKKTLAVHGFHIPTQLTILDSNTSLTRSQSGKCIIIVWCSTSVESNCIFTDSWFQHETLLGITKHHKFVLCVFWKYTSHQFSFNNQIYTYFSWLRFSEMSRNEISNTIFSINK